jgi:hypothetical protein
MVKNQKSVYLTGFVLALLGLAGLVVSAMAGDKGKTGHPQLSEQEMLRDCADCHREATPAVEKEWFNSVHGIAMVKCYQCHGTFEDFSVTPAKETCGACHTNMLQKCPQDKPCWECHVPHTFKNKK